MNDEDSENVMRELSTLASVSDPLVVLSYFRPEDALMRQIADAKRAPRAWFYKETERLQPISGTMQGIFVYGHHEKGVEAGIPFSYVPLQ